MFISSNPTENKIKIQIKTEIQIKVSCWERWTVARKSEFSSKHLKIQTVNHSSHFNFPYFNFTSQSSERFTFEKKLNKGTWIKCPDTVRNNVKIYQMCWMLKQKEN